MKAITKVGLGMMWLALGCGGHSMVSDECQDPDHDGYGTGAACMGPDCAPADNACWEGSCCTAVDCVDPDGDNYGTGADCLGSDCTETDNACWAGACCQMAAQCTHYVDATTTSTDWPAAQNIDTPCTADTAMQNAQAGDVVCFRGGVYDLGYHSHYEHPVLAPAHDGTVDSPITFVAHPGETPILNGHVRVKVTGVAGAGSDNTQLVDNNVDFTQLGIVAWDIVRTPDWPGGAPVAEVSAHTIVFDAQPVHNTINLSPGDAYEVGMDYVLVLGNYFHNYIVWNGFVVQANDGVEHAQTLIKGVSDDAPALGAVLRNLVIRGGTRRIVHGDNREALRFDSTRGGLVTGCRVTDFRQMNDWHNTSGYKGYHNWDLVIERTEFDNCSTAVYFKSVHYSCSLRNSFLHDNNEGFLQTVYLTRSSPGTEVYNNVFANNDANITFNAEEDATSDDTHVYNNTLYAAPGVIGIWFTQGARWRAYNNVIQGCDNQQYTLGYDVFSVAESDYNQFGPDDLTITTFLYITNDRYYTVDDWRTSGILENGDNPGLHSMASDPEFANPSGTMSELGDFCLSATSPSRGAGKNGGDMGAPVELVGPAPPRCPGQ